MKCEMGAIERLSTALWQRWTNMFSCRQLSEVCHSVFIDFRNSRKNNNMLNPKSSNKDAFVWITWGSWLINDVKILKIIVSLSLDILCNHPWVVMLFVFVQNEEVNVYDTVAGLIPGFRPANERRLYKVTLSLIGWVQIWNQAWVVYMI